MRAGNHKQCYFSFYFITEDLIISPKFARILFNRKGKCIMLMWDFKISENMVNHLEIEELSLFLTALEDSIEEICARYNVEPWEFQEEE